MSVQETRSDILEPPGTSGRQRWFPEVPDAQWNDWTWQLRNRIRSFDELAQYLDPPVAEGWMRQALLRHFRMAVTPYYLSLVNPDDPEDPILRQAVPRAEEYLYRDFGEADPLHEEEHSPVPGLTHRYPDRALMVVSNHCAVYCRHCTRKRMMQSGAVPLVDLQRMLGYIAEHPEIRDVVVSGGDPLTLGTQRLERILAGLRAIPHVEIIRIGSRVPVTLPQRITPELCAMLERYHPVWVNTHFNHPRECSPEAAQACDRLLRAGIPLGNQSVLLKGVNDDLETMRSLLHSLVRMRVRPYYLYQCDPVRGSEHLRTSLKTGIDIIEGLRGHTSGLCLPTFVVDAPGGGGKIPVGPEYLLSYDPASGEATLRNFSGQRYSHRDPEASEGLSELHPLPVSEAPILAETLRESSRWARRRARMGKVAG